MCTVIRGISSMATRGLLAELASLYAARDAVCGTVRVSFESVGGVDAAQRVNDGEAFDLVVLASEAIDRLATAGRVDAAHTVDIASSCVGVAVRAGAPRPDIASEDALRRAVCRAGRIAFSTGPSGVALNALFVRWGIADEIATRLVQAPPGTPVGVLLARGDAELGFQQMSELLGLEGVALLGPLPTAVQITTVFSAAPVRGSACQVAVNDLLRFMASAAGDAARQRHGLLPPPASPAR
ncbi:substrate-binding domain-containing protein [Variovorax sp. LT2P21]|uniref:substrate-binding domain-containing protein n=1 Tax=Variovorax sp. LT2P21 TaxID=3443731 RepID=UPI003F44B109